MAQRSASLGLLAPLAPLFPLARAGLGALVPLGVLLLWELLSRQGAAFAYAFVSVGDVGRALLELLANGELLTNFLSTLGTAATGLLLGGVAGLVVGAAMGISRTVDILIGPLYHTIRQVPLLGWIPLIGLWFGNGPFAKHLVVATAVFYPMVLHTYEGLRHVDSRYREVGAVFRFSPWQQFRHVAFPNAMPAVITGLLNALAFAWIATVGSELLFSTGPGLGGLMQVAQAASRMDVVLVCIATIGVVGFGMNLMIGRISKWLLRWRNVR